MRCFGRAFVRTQVILAGRHQVLMAQDVLDMPDGASVEKQRGRDSMAKNVRRDLLAKAGCLPESAEPSHGRAPGQLMRPGVEK